MQIIEVEREKPALTSRILDNNLITHHGNRMLIFDLEPPGKAEVEFVCDVKTPEKPFAENYQYICKGAHTGGAVSLIVFNISDVRDDDGLSIDYDRIEWADDRTICDDGLVLDFYFDLIRDDIKEIIKETWD